MMINTIWTQTNCQPCTAAKTMLTKAGIAFDIKTIGSDVTKEDFYKEFPNARSVPQIYLDGKHIGGLNELKEYLSHDRN